MQIERSWRLVPKRLQTPQSGCSDKGLRLHMSAVTLQVLANGDANSPAMERMTQLVREALALSAGMAVANPRGTFAFHSLNMDAAAPSNAEEAPGPDYWARIVVSPHLSYNQLMIWWLGIMSHPFPSFFCVSSNSEDDSAIVCTCMRLHKGCCVSHRANVIKVW